MTRADRKQVRQVDPDEIRDVEHFDERAERFREVHRELTDRACVSPVEDLREVNGRLREELSTPAAYGSIDDVAIVDAAKLPAWYRDRLAAGDTLSQQASERMLETVPDDETEDPAALAAEEYLRLDVVVDEGLWDTYVPIPQTPAEYEGSAFATLRERLDGRSIEEFHCARMPIRYERGRYVPDYGSQTYDRWLRERGFVRWTAEDGYELKPGLHTPALLAGATGMAATVAVSGVATLAFLFVLLPLVPELFLVGMWVFLPMAYLCSLSVGEWIFTRAFARLGASWKHR
ncbi:MAG: hypothetical protein PPP58_03650 [Natronomonas sp.]